MDLLVFAKEPLPGRVKTRLCPPCTADQAAALATAALADTLAAACTSAADRVVLALDGRPGSWCPTGVDIVDQGRGDLATRLTQAWAATAGPALQIGMDTPQIGADDLDRAMATLVERGVDAVLGPAADGGWWAIGLRRPHPRTFTGIPTSRPDTGARQADRLAALGLRTRRLAVHRDIDTWADALAVAESRPDLRFAATLRRVRTQVAGGPADRANDRRWPSDRRSSDQEPTPGRPTGPRSDGGVEQWPQRADASATAVSVPTASASGLTRPNRRGVRHDLQDGAPSERPRATRSGRVACPVMVW